MLKFFRYLFLFLAFPFLAYSQELKLVKEHVESNITVQYHVLATNPKIRQGLYQKFIGASNTLIEQGYYKNNLKDSLWTYYNILGNVRLQGSYLNGIKNGYWKIYVFPANKPVITEEGNYDLDKRVGVWIFRNWKDSLDNKYDYDTKKVIEYGKTDDVFTLIDKKDTIATLMDKPPVHIGGMDTLEKLLGMNLRMPIPMQLRGSVKINYKAFVSFVINENGRLEEFRVVRGNNEQYNAAAIKALKLWDDGSWIPGYYNGHTVKVVKIIPITFKANIPDLGPLIPPNAVIVR